MLTRMISIVVGVFVLAVLGALASDHLERARVSDQGAGATSRTPQAASPSPTPTTGKPAQARQIDRTWPSKFNIVTRSITEKTSGIDSYELLADYPEVAKTRDRRVRKFNQWIRGKVLGYAARFRNLARAERRNKKRRGSPIEMGLELSFIVYYSDNRLISMRLTHRVMERGQMHPINYYETINYDLDRGRPLRVGEVFKRGYLNVLSDYSRQYLKDTYDMLDEWLYSGTKPRLDSFANWNIVPDGILISFEDYQVDSHAFGQPEFVVPYSTLRNKIVRVGPAHRFLERPSG